MSMKKICVMLLLAMWMVTMLASGASAALNNAELQLAGGLVCVNDTDTFFVAPTGETDEWGLYSVNTRSGGPIALIRDVKPARMLYADSKKVYLLAMKVNGEFLVASVGIVDGALTNELDGIAGAFYEGDTTLFYVPSDDLYTLSRFDLLKGSSSKLKTMTSKTIYDACVINGGVYFLGLDGSDKVIIYEINKKSGKAVNMSNPSPSMGDGFLYGNYLLYHQKGDQTKIYSMPIGSSKGTLLGGQVAGLSLNSPRIGNAMYPYDGSSSSIVRVPLDGSSQASIPTVASLNNNYLIGGTEERIYYWDDGAIYSVDSALQGKTALVEFDINTDKMKWTYLSPTNQNYMLIMGYMPITYADFGVTLPTAVRLVDLNTKETVFQYPALADDAQASEGLSEGTGIEPPVATGVIDTPQAVLVEEVGEDEDVSFKDIFGGGN